ncbi:MAG: PAS domain-containing protein, partial [Gloeomargarita sp. DG_1_5_bins_55]
MTPEAFPQVWQAFPYPIVWVEQQAPGEYHSQILNGSPAHPLPLDSTEWHQLAARCLTRQQKQRQWFTCGETDYWVELTPLSATQALGLVIASPLGMEHGMSLCPYTDQAPVVIWLADKQGQMTYLNHQWTVLTGWPAERALGQGWFDLVHPEDSALL